MSTPEQEPSDPTALLVGQAVRNARQKAGVSMRTLAVLSGVSQPFLSQVERGRSVPSVATLYKIAAALDVPPASLVPTPRDPDIQVVRADDDIARPLSEDQAAPMGRFAQFRGRLNSVVEYRIEPHHEIDAWFQSNSETLLLLVEGSLVVELEGHQPVLLHAGDWMLHPGEIRHRWVWPESGRRYVHAYLVLSDDRTAAPD